MLDRIPAPVKDSWPAALILVLYVALMGVPGHLEVGEMRRERDRLETPEAAQARKMNENRVQSLQQRMLRIEQRVQETRDLSQETVVTAPSARLRTVGRLLAEHSLVLVEEGPSEGNELWKVRFHGSYVDVAEFMADLSKVDPAVVTDSLDMEVPSDQGPAWTLRFIP